MRLEANVQIILVTTEQVLFSQGFISGRVQQAGSSSFTKKSIAFSLHAESQTITYFVAHALNVVLNHCYIERAS